MIKDNFNGLMDALKNMPDKALYFFTKNIIKNNLGNLPILYRYSPADYYNIRGIETETVHLSSIGTMNDIFEGLPCETNDEILQQLHHLNDIAFLKSFTEEGNNPLMWAHYASSYSGICVAYDFKNLNDDALYHLFPVCYSSNRMVSRGLEAIAAELVDLKRMNEDNNYPNDTENIQDIMSLFLKKSKAWEDEKEWRMVATYPQIFNEAQDIDYENSLKEHYLLNSQTVSVNNCIKEIYLGPRIEPIMKEHIKEICKTRLNNVQVYSAKLSEEEYKLNYVREEN